MNNNLSLGEKIKLARKNKHLKQSDLSKILGIANTTISSWETNQSKPDLNILESLCEILEVNPNYFFNLNPKNTLTINELELLKKIRMLDERGLTVLTELINLELKFNLK